MRTYLNAKLGRITLAPLEVIVDAPCQSTYNIHALRDGYQDGFEIVSVIGGPEWVCDD